MPNRYNASLLGPGTELIYGTIVSDNDPVGLIFRQKRHHSSIVDEHIFPWVGDRRVIAYGNEGDRQWCVVLNPTSEIFEFAVNGWKPAKHGMIEFNTPEGSYFVHQSAYSASGEVGKRSKKIKKEKPQKLSQRPVVKSSSSDDWD